MFVEYFYFMVQFLESATSGF